VKSMCIVSEGTAEREGITEKALKCVESMIK
jgi:hypothetical protein